MLGVIDEIDRVLLANGPMTIDGIALSIQVSKSKVRRGLVKLRFRGLIRKADKPKSFADQMWEHTRSR